MNQPSVLLLRQAQASKHLHEAFVGKGFQMVYAPTLAIESLAVLPHTRTDLVAALACAAVIFTSPNAVLHAANLHSLSEVSGAVWAIGSATRQALIEHGCVQAHTGETAHSESMLAAMWSSMSVLPKAIGLVTAPNGRGFIDADIAAHGVLLQRADVYRRVPQSVPQSTWASVAQIAERQSLVTVLTSQQAWASLAAQTSVELQQAITAQPVVVSSTRLAKVAADAGFHAERIHNTQSMQPEKLALAAFEAAQIR